MKDENNNSELYSICDEAFTLLLLENYWDRWWDIYTKAEGHPTCATGSNKKKKSESDVRPKYTSGGNIYENESTEEKTNRGKGWSNEGIKCYNALFKWVIQDCKTRPMFIEKYLNRKRKERNERVQKVPAKKSEVVLPLSELGMYHSLPMPKDENGAEEVVEAGASSSDDHDSDEETDIEGIH